MAAQLQQFFQAQGIANNEFLQDFCSQWKTKCFAKNEVITHEGNTEQYIYFVLEGLQKSVFVNHGKEHVIAFTYPGSFSGVPDSLFGQLPSKCTLTAVSPTRLLAMSYQEFESRVKEHPQLQELFLSMLKGLLVGTIGRLYELHAYSMEERFLAFFERSKHLINQLPRKDIASYLSIDPSNLSKLLSKHSRILD